MWKLIKMDFYRLFSSRAIKVGALVACAVCAAYMFFSLGIVVLTKFAIDTDPASVVEMGAFLSQVGWVAGANFSDIVFAGTSAFALFIGCMITASFIGSEQSCGYTKNFAGQLSNKGSMAVSKFVVTSVAQTLILVVYTAVSALMAELLFGQYITGYDLKALALALGLKLLLHLAINAIIIFVCTLTKSHAVAMVVGCIFGIGVTKFAYIVIGMLLSALKINLSLSDYMPDGILSQLEVANVGDLAVKAIVVSLVFIVAFISANWFILRKRDVR